MKLSLFKQELFLFVIFIIGIYLLIYGMAKLYGGYLLDPKHDESVNFIIALLFTLGVSLKVFKKESISVAVDVFTILITILLTMRSTIESKDEFLNSTVAIVCVFLPMFYVYIMVLCRGIKNTNNLTSFYNKNYKKDLNENNNATNKNKTSYFSRPAFYIDKINKELQKNEEYAYVIEVKFESIRDQKKVKGARDLMARYFAERGYIFDIRKIKKQIKNPSEPDKIIVVSWADAEG